MNVQEMRSQVLSKWLDTNGLVKTHQEWVTSGNGILYSSMLVLLCAGWVPKDDWFLPTVGKCFKRPGLLMRNPQNSFGQESWDDYLGLIAACAMMGNTKVARQVLWYGITHFGFYNNLSPFNLNAFLFRFPQIWVLAWPTAFPFLEKIFFIPLWIVAQFQTLDATNPGAILTSWCYLKACSAFGFRFKKYREASAMLPLAISNQFEKGHPFTLFA